MADLMDLIQSQVSDGLVDQLTKQLGGAEKSQTQTAVNTAMTTLLGALSRNASKPEGASALASALDRDHDGSILDDLTGFLGGSNSSSNASMLNGAGILNHVLGGKQNGAIDMIAKVSGLDKSKTGQLMVTLAPMIMGMLGKVKKERNLDQNGLSDFLKTSTSEVVKKQPQSRGLLESILDKDGDGSIMDDVAQSGFRALLGRLFKR
jgi:hypothetical protein